MESKHRQRSALWLLLALIASPSWAMAQEPPTASKQRQEELRRLADDPRIQRANEAWLQASQIAIQRHLRTLATRGDARNLLAAAMLSNGFRPTEPGEADGARKRPPKTQAWFDAARRVRPRDALVAQIEANGCERMSEHCDASEALAYLLQAEPDNAAVQLAAMAAAERRSDAAGADAHWQAAAKARIFAPGMLAVSQLLYASMQGVGYPPLDPALADAMGVWWGLQRPATPADFADIGMIGITAATTLPNFLPITRRCKPAVPETADPALRQQCQRVLELLAADQSNVIAPMIGLNFLVQMNGDSETGMVWRERLRQFYWVYENALQRLAGTRSGPSPVEYGSWFMREGEVAAMRKLIARLGVPAQAPAGWLPEEPRYRALVATGRLPADAK